MGSGDSRKYSCLSASSELIRLAGQYVRNLEAAENRRVRKPRLSDSQKRGLGRDDRA